MERLDGSDSRFSELGDEMRDSRAGRVRDRRDAPNGLDELDGLSKRATNARDVEGRPLIEIRQEGLVEIFRHPDRDELTGDVHPARDPSGALEDSLGRDGKAGSRQARHHPRYPFNPLAAQGLERIEQVRVLEVDPVAEYVDLAITVHRGELDSGDETKAEPARRLGCPGDAVDSVVIGESDGLETRASRELHDLFRRMHAVGCVAVYVEIDTQ